MRKVICITLLLANLIVLGLNVKSQFVTLLDTKEMYILPNCNVIGNYIVTSDNTISCDLTTYSFIINSMKLAGYSIIKDTYTSDSIDIIFSNNLDKFRIVYTSEGNCTSISDKYEKSYIPFTYIIGR